MCSSDLGFSEFFSYGSLNKFDGTVGVQPYRPLTLLYFGIQKTFFDNSTSAAHLLNVLLYALLSLVLFSLLQRLFPKLHVWFIGLITLLFVAHPIHTEVICSVKSVDELLAGLFGFLASANVDSIHFDISFHASIPENPGCFAKPGFD